MRDSEIVLPMVIAEPDSEIDMLSIQVIPKEDTEADNGS